MVVFVSQLTKPQTQLRSTLPGKSVFLYIEKYQRNTKASFTFLSFFPRVPRISRRPWQGTDTKSRSQAQMQLSLQRQRGFSQKYKFSGPELNTFSRVQKQEVGYKNIGHTYSPFLARKTSNLFLVSNPYLIISAKSSALLLDNVI